jgi:hypothetical protein
LNHFNYFTEIEDAFIRRRAKHLLLSPMDWALIESWKEMDVPLHVALRGIEKAFDSWESKPRKRSIKSLLYCQEEVEAQFLEWREARVGATDEASSSEASDASEASKDGLPFSRTAILEHLQRGRASLLEICSARQQAGADDFTEMLERATGLLREVAEDFAASVAPNAQKLEQSLSGLERMISDAARAIAGPEQIATIEAEVKKQLQPYRKHMESAAYQQTFDNLVLKRLREQFGIPRLSLFYL